MFLMMAEVLHLSRVARALPESGFWAFLARQQSHVPWVGCTLHDLIQPGFSFLVGTALAFSVANRQSRGQPFLPMFGHAAWRALILILLGVFLRSVGAPQTRWTFEDTLSQIGLGYLPLFLLAFRPRRDQWIALGVLLLGTWLAFALYPAAGPDHDFAAVGVTDEWLAAHGLSGFAAHWQKNANLAWAFDHGFLNLFPRPQAWEYNGGGYATLSFVPTLATMLLGLIAGGVLRHETLPSRRLGRLLTLGVAGLALGALLGMTGLCPVVKRIWTPSWVLFSGGWCFLILAAFHVLLDRRDGHAWAFPLRVIGMNSIAAYVIAQLWDDFFESTLRTHLGPGFFQALGAAYAPLLEGAVILALYWLVLFWMHRRGLFLRI
ncbi:MAG: DUF5009 domain-containing protein [Verrucomicrobiae bacterium]|nr:DUF5009 domain-containing protein [Verrucomicrobiae bacterium]